MTLLEAPTGTEIFCYRAIKQEIVHTLLLEKYGVSKEWVIILDRRHVSNNDFASSSKKWTFGSGSFLCQWREKMAGKKRRIETSLVIVMIMLHVLTYVVSYKQLWNWIKVVQFVSQEILQKVWFDKMFVIWHFLEYSLKQVVYLWSFDIGVQNIFTTNELADNIRNLKSNAFQNDQNIFYGWLKRKNLLKKKHALQTRFFNEEKCAAGKSDQIKCAAGQIFDWILMVSLSYVESVWFIFNKSQLRIFVLWWIN